MTTAPTDSLLTADIGSVNTRTALLDIVSGEFRFIAAGRARSTVEPPFSYISEGLRHALEHMLGVTGRKLIDESDNLVMPSRADGSGVDAFAATASAAAPLRVALVGLMPNISLATAQRAVLSTYAVVVEAISLGDRRREDQQLDALLNAKPDAVVIVGGTEQGSQSAVLKLTETVALASHLLPQHLRPSVLFAGNSALRQKIKEIFTGLAEVWEVDNLHPELGEENLIPVRRQLAHLYERLRVGRITGYADLAQASGGRILPSATAFGLMIRFLNSANGGNKGVLGVDVGSASTVIAAAFNNELSLTVRPDIGVGHSAVNVLHRSPIGRLIRWLPEEFTEDEVRDYLHNKSLRPATIPHDVRDLYLEHALARQCIQVAMASAMPNWNESARKAAGGLMPTLDPIIGSGSVLAYAPRAGQAALMLLDGAQPTGVSTLILDSQNLAAALGAAGTLNPIAAVQILRSNSFMALGTAISLVGRAGYGQTAARARLTLPGGEKIDSSVEFGSIAVLPLPTGEEGKLTIQPARGFDAGFGKGVAKTFAVTGGEVGVIIDARGRPIAFPNSAVKRYEAINKWKVVMGGYGA